MKKIVIAIAVISFLKGAQPEQPDQDRPLNVLCIDGGGVRGIIPAVFLKEIEKRTGRSINANFDVFCGTSTGGLLATACSLQGSYAVDPNAQNNDSSDRFSPDKLISFYENESSKIFRSSWYRRCFSLFSRYQYSNKVIYEKLKEQFDERMLQDITNGKRLFLTIVGAQTNKLVVVDSKDPQYKRSLLKDLCLATSAAPTYFPPVSLTINDDEALYVDGGMKANNPALEVFLRLRKEYPNKKINLISLGTGINCNPYVGYLNVLKRITLNWIQPSLEMLFSAQSESADEYLKILAEIDPINFKYYRLQSSLQTDQLAMDKTNKDHLGALKNAALITLSGSIAKIQEIVSALNGDHRHIQTTEPISIEREVESQENHQRELFVEQEKQLPTKKIKQKISGSGNITIGCHRGMSNVSAEDNIDVDQDVEGNNNQTIGGNTDV